MLVCNMYFNMQYIPPSLLHICQKWGRVELVTLTYRGMNYTVHMRRSRRDARFGIGWDWFVSNSNIAIGDHLLFIVIGPSMFEVSLIS